MKLVRPNSLAATLDAVTESFFFGRNLTRPEREQAARWIAARRGKPGSYAGMFAPTERDLKQGFKVFTGEDVRTRAATGHILGEEACRALTLLKVNDPGVREALARADLGMLKRLREYETRYKVHGLYCCGTCSGAYWRYLAVGGLDKNEQRLVAGMKALRAHRLGKGLWRRFPFFYTLLALSELDLRSALDEMRYAAPVCERYLKRASGRNRYSRRRHVLAERVLARI